MDDITQTNIPKPGPVNQVPPVNTRIWVNSTLISLLLLLFFIILTSIYVDGAFGLPAISKSLAASAMIMFGISFSLSGFCFYWDFLDSKITYRKYFGVVGYWHAVAYSISLILVDPQRYWYGFFDNLWSGDFIFGISAMIIFSFMTIISNKRLMMKLGPRVWRKCLRLGYIAWFFLVLRSWSIEKDLWYDYFMSFEGFPPPRLLMSLFVIAVILFRISIDVTKRIRSNNKYT